VHAGTDFELPRHKALVKQKTAHIANHHPGINTVRTVHGTAVTGCTLAPCNLHGMQHKCRVHISFTAYHFTEGMLDFVGRNLLRIFVIGSIKKTAFRTHAAVCAHFKPCTGTAFAGCFQVFAKHIHIYFQMFHFFVILFATLITQKMFYSFSRCNRLSFAINTFRHCQLLL
jgi:hypothetical protein